MKLSLRNRKPYFVAIVIGSLLNAGLMATTQQFESLGTFSNMQYTAEHQYGTSVQLWRQGGEIVGFLSNAAGLQGDTPRGILENVHYDRKTGALSFQAKLSMGSIDKSDPYSPRADKMSSVRSSELFVFQGTLKKDALVGKLGIADGYLPNPVPTEFKDLTLRSRKVDFSLPIKASTLDEWKNEVKRLELDKPSW